jgi:hypothetical protein
VAFETTEALSNLFIFDTELLAVGNGKPFTSSVYLKMLWNRLLQRGMFQNLHHLPLDMPLSDFENPHGNRLSRNHTASNHNGTSILSMSESFSAENQLFNEYGRKNFILVHENVGYGIGRQNLL